MAKKAKPKKTLRKFTRSARITKSLKMRATAEKEEKAAAAKEEKAAAAKEEAKQPLAVCDSIGPQHHPLVPRPLSKGSGGGKRPTLTPLMRANIIPKINESMAFLGGSGSGKTTNLLWMLTQDHLMPKSMFKEIFLISFTGKADKSFDVLKLDDDHIITKDLQDRLERIFEKQKTSVEAGDRAPILIILEDITSSYKLIRSPIFTKLFTAGRHYWITLMVVAHKFTALSRVARINCMNLMMYPSNGTELEQIREDHSPPGMHKKDFNSMVNHAWTADDTQERPFLYINNTQPHKTRFRKGFAELITLP
jgi:hypothetical protein